MTEKLYDADPHLLEFSATVLSCYAEGEHYRVILDRTAFFPCEGGQGADHGTLGAANVLDVLLEGDTLIHLTDAPLEPSAEVEGRLDVARRRRMMQTHTAEHILSGVCHTLYGTQNVGFHLGDSEVTLDLDLPLSEEEVAAAEEAANRAIWENRPVRVLYPTPEELPLLDYRAKLDLKEGVRLVEIEGVDLCACCAPHVDRTGECGLLKVTGYMHYKGGVRLHIAVGCDALADHREKQATVHAASFALSVPEREVTAGLLRLMEAAAEERRAHAATRATLRRERLLAVRARGEGHLVLTDIAPSELRAYAEEGAEVLSATILVLLPEGEVTRYALAAPSGDVRPLSASLHTALGGRGGGKPTLVQGSIPAGVEAILAALEGL